MKAKTTLVALTAIALLAGCNRGAANNSAKAANAASANAAAPAAVPAAPAAAPAPAAAAGAPVDAAFLAAHPWAPPGKCDEALTFGADGTLSSGDESGTWTLAGDSLTMNNGEGQSQTFTVARSGENLMMTQGGQSMTVGACPAG